MASHSFSKRFASAALVIGAVLLTPQSVSSHGGGLNAQGCHNNRKTGDYHCHRSYGGGGGGSSAPRPARVMVTSIPKAKIWIDGKYAGVSPTKLVKTSSGEVTIRLEHPVLGTHEGKVQATSGERVNWQYRW